MRPPPLVRDFLPRPDYAAVKRRPIAKQRANRLEAMKEPRRDLLTPEEPLQHFSQAAVEARVQTFLEKKNPAAADQAKRRENLTQRDSG